MWSVITGQINNIADYDIAEYEKINETTVKLITPEVLDLTMPRLGRAICAVRPHHFFGKISFLYVFCI